MREYLIICMVLIFARCAAADTGPDCCYPAWSEDHHSLSNQTVFFQSGKAALNAEGKVKAAQVANCLKTNRVAAVRIEGYTDDHGTDEYNRWLGDRRAQVVRKELIKAGIDPARIDTISFGRDRPVDPGHTAEARAKNCRAEFVLLTPPTLEEAPHNPQGGVNGRQPSGSETNRTSAADPIDRLAAWLTAPSEDLPFPNGPWLGISLPATAEPKELVSRALAPEDTASSSIVSTRKLHLVAKGMEGLGDPNYTAVRVNTRSGQNIVLLQFNQTVWESRVYDTKNLPNP